MAQGYKQWEGRGVGSRLFVKGKGGQDERNGGGVVVKHCVGVGSVCVFFFFFFSKVKIFFFLLNTKAK